MKLVVVTKAFSGLLLALTLSACATATRGSTTMFFVETTPVGAKATTTIPTKEFGMMTKGKLNLIKTGHREEPDFEFRFCEPTPCGVEIPRKQNFHVLVTKEGYVPQIAEVGYLHRKKIKKETIRNTALAAGTVGVATGVAIASTTTSGVYFSAGATGAFSGVILATPIVMIGGVSLGVDAATGANYDVWPNPLPLTLVASDTAEQNALTIDIANSDFSEMQRNNAMFIEPTPREARRERQRLKALKNKERRRQKKIEKEKQNKAKKLS